MNLYIFVEIMCNKLHITKKNLCVWLAVCFYMCFTIIFKIFSSLLITVQETIKGMAGRVKIIWKSTRATLLTLRKDRKILRFYRSIWIFVLKKLLVDEH